jgi:hypothetical protein
MRGHIKKYCVPRKYNLGCVGSATVHNWGHLGFIVLIAFAGPKLTVCAFGADQSPQKKIHIPEFLSRQLVDLFEQGQIAISAVAGGEQKISYELFKPRNDAAKKYPLIVWLSGYGDKETQEFGQLAYLEETVFRDPTHPEQYQFFLLAPHLPDGIRFWQPEVVMPVIDKVISGNPIDPQAVSLVGISSGGSASWRIAIAHPDRFSALVPMASMGCLTPEIEKLAKVPVWVFHSDQDAHAPIENDRVTIAALKEAGGICKLNELHNRAHDCWGPAFQDHDLLNWLISERQGQPTTFPPSQGPSTSRKLQAILGGLLAFIKNAWPQLILLSCMAGLLFYLWRRSRNTLPKTYS